MRRFRITGESGELLAEGVEFESDGVCAVRSPELHGFFATIGALVEMLGRDRPSLVRMLDPEHP